MKRFCLLFILLSGGLAEGLYAQHAFSEGVLIYTIRGTTGGEKGSQQSFAGTYTIAIKNELVSKTVELESGYWQTMLYQPGQAGYTTLREAAGIKYAITLDSSAYAKKVSADAVTSYDCHPLKKEIAGYKASSCAIAGSKEPLILSQETFQLPAAAFERFQHLTALPLQFSYTTGNGSTMIFTLKSLEEKPVETNLFRIGPDYKIITSQEYDSLTKQ